jgi:hypothetical protein
MNTIPHWTAYVAALMTPLVAAFGIYLAARQVFLARNKLKLDLFDRRMRLWDATQTLRRAVFEDEEIPRNISSNYQEAVSAAKWLTGNEVHEAMYKLAQYASLARQHQEYMRTTTGEVWTVHRDELEHVGRLFQDQMQNIKEALDPYLKIEH